MNRILPVLFILTICLTESCAQKSQDSVISAIPYLYNKEHTNPRMRFKVLQSAFRDNNSLTESFKEEILLFGEKRYQTLKPLILEQDIPTIQQHIRDKKFTYRELTCFYIYRIHAYETNPELFLNAVISLNPDAIREAEQRDREMNNDGPENLIYGMPVLLKDNIGFKGLPVTAGAVVLQNNMAEDAFIVRRLKEKGAIILGKVNLSEWAYYFCSGCPLGYSAIGGQSLNPYGRMIFETGGSSSGSGTAIAANYAVAAVGTETSGSILSPSSLNSVTGLKPTVGLLSRTGIIPISETLDTPGPMTKNVTDNAILMDAMTGYDLSDSKSKKQSGTVSYFENLKSGQLKGKRFGVFKNLKEHANYLQVMNMLEKNGAEVIEIEPKETSLPGFLTLLNMDMKSSLPAYLSEHSSEEITLRTLEDIVSFNLKDLKNRAPYGQALFDGIIADTTSNEEFEKIKSELERNSRSYFDELLKTNNLDAVLSINNFHAGFAAVAKYPCMTLSMGYKENGEPQGITLIVQNDQEVFLYQLAFRIEEELKARKMPEKYN